MQYFCIFILSKFSIICLVISDLQECAIPQIKATDILFSPYFITFGDRINFSEIGGRNLFFKHRIDIIGKAILLTSFTTSISFLTFLFNDIIPIARFGVITSFGILLTLVVVTVVYAISIDYNFNKVKEHRLLKILMPSCSFIDEETTIFFLFGNGLPIDSNVFLPIIIGLLSE